MGSVTVTHGETIINFEAYYEEEATECDQWRATALALDEVTDAQGVVIAQLHSEIARLKVLLWDASDEIEGWGSYASDYFKDKHNLAGTVKMYRSLAGQ